MFDADNELFEYDVFMWFKFKLFIDEVLCTDDKIESNACCNKGDLTYYRESI